MVQGVGPEQPLARGKQAYTRNAIALIRGMKQYLQIVASYSLVESALLAALSVVTVW